jgi:hypothetical protein
MFPEMPFKQPSRVTTDLSKIEDAKCIKCQNTKFTMLGTIKMISPIQSSSGKWDTAIQTAWVCSTCGHPFNANEWLHHEAEELAKAQRKH